MFVLSVNVFLCSMVMMFVMIVRKQKMIDTKSILADIFGNDTVDEELWAELDSMDEGQRINVPMCVFDLKRIKQIIGKQKMTFNRFMNILVYDGDTSGIHPGRLRAMYARVIADMDLESTYGKG